MNRRLTDWLDGTVRASDGDVGTMAQVYFDDLTWIIRYMAVNIAGKRSGRSALISLAALGKPDWRERVFPVTLTMAQVRSSPTLDIDRPVSRQHEVALHEHYAWPAYWRGGFYVVRSGAGMTTGPAGDAEAAAETPASEVRKVDPHLRNTRDVMGCRVHAMDGNIGHVEDCLVDEKVWAIRYLVVNTRKWLPDRRVLVSPRWITRVNWADKKVLVDLTRDAVKKSPEYDPSKRVSSDYESNLRARLRKPEVTEWVIFKFHAHPGADIHVAGTFNNWDPAAIKLGDNGKGTYTATVLIPLGVHEYKFIVNGDWRNGPGAKAQVPNAFGTTNNVLVAGRRTTREGHLHTFPRQPGFDGDRLLWSTPMGG